MLIFNLDVYSILQSSLEEPVGYRSIATKVLRAVDQWILEV